MATTKDGIWSPNVDDNFRPSSDLATMASTVQSALEKRANSYTGTTSQRTAFTTDAPEGTLWSDTNGEKILWIKQGTGWQRIWPIPDTGWVDLPASVLASGVTGSVQVRVVGGMAMFRGLLTATFVGNTNLPVINMPEPYRPLNSNESIRPVISNVAEVGRIQGFSSGNTQVRFPTPGSKTFSVSGLEYQV